MAYLPANYQPMYYSGVGQQVYPQYQQAQMSQQMSAAQQPNQQSGHGLIWVDGEVGAKAYQIPAGWPANQPIALWDTNDTVIYLKSTNPMGMPNPLQKAKYTLEGTKSGEASQGYSGTGAESPFVTKEDLEKMKKDIMDAMNQKGNANGRHEKED